MKISRNNISKLLAGAFLLCGVSAVVLSCKREVPTVSEGQNPMVTFVASVDKSVQTMLTPSDVTTGGVFELGDTVGLYLFDQRGGIAAAGQYSYLNIPYVAQNDEGRILFSPIMGEQNVFYKTYYLHNVYAYYPYNAINTAAATAEGVKMSVYLDQTVAKTYAMSDFMTCRLADVKPQQINPAAPELRMNFSHQFTSVVVKVRNADNSPMIVHPVITVINTATQAVVDITKATPVFMGRSVEAPIVLQEKIGYTDVNYPTQLCYFGIAIPQSFTAGKSILKVKIGTGSTARVYEYLPKATDPIFVAGGFAQGKEHVFDFVINGTELIVQGGEIAEWGTGTKSITEIDGQGKSAARMFFDIQNATGEALNRILTIRSAEITIDGVVRSTMRLNFDQPKSLISCNYYQDSDWGYDVTRVVFKNNLNVAVLTCIPDSPIRIKGNPTADNYSTVIATIDAATGVITAK